MDINKIQSTMLEHGLNAPASFELGKIKRFPSAGKPSNNRDAWLLVHDNGGGITFGDWTTDLNETKFFDDGRTLTDTEKAHYKLEARKAKQRLENERIAIQATAATKATGIWNGAKPLPSNYPYLTSKRVPPLHARVTNGNMILAVINAALEITSLQTILPNGQKKLFPNGRKKGSFIHVDGDLINPETIIICEGWSTGVSLTHSYPQALVLAAIDCHNLAAVSWNVAVKWPNAKITIAGDDDRAKPDNVGRAKAKEAARHIGASLIFPKFPEGAPIELSDFNDLANYMAGVTNV